METNESAFVLGQRHAFATLALIVALLSFLNVAGLEKAVLAIVLASKALARTPAPPLETRRGWARGALVLGSSHILLLAGVILWNLDRLQQVIDVFRALSDLR